MGIKWFLKLSSASTVTLLYVLPQQLQILMGCSLLSDKLLSVSVEAHSTTYVMIWLWFLH